MTTDNPLQLPHQLPRAAEEPNDHEIIRTSRTVDERFLAALVRRIVAVSGATRVILFGSRARHEECDDSDVDLFVILPSQGPEQAQERDVKRRAISQALFDRWIPLDIIVRTEDDVRRATALGDPFIVDDILREGRELYAG